LRTFTSTSDGFALAEEDARQRGSGDLLGTRQHGAGELRFADPVAEPDLLHLARKDAFDLVLQDALLTRPEHAGLRAAVLRRYRETLELATIG
jgi:ATP-dependent DNA helicase RecG